MYILTGKRLLSGDEKQTLSAAGTPEALAVLKANNEAEAMQWVYQDVFSNTPEPMVMNDANPKGVRATARGALGLFFDQIQSTRETWPNQRLLVASTHIFSLRQFLVVKQVAFERGFTGKIDICAPSFEGSEYKNSPRDRNLTMMILDNLARTFYEICQYKRLTGQYPE